MIFAIMALLVSLVFLVHKYYNIKFDLYLAGPMRGYEELNIPLFKKVAKDLRTQGYTIFNPGDENDTHLSFEECMRKDLDAVVNRCKAIALLPGWRNSIGANAEVLSALVCGKKIYYVSFSSDGKSIIGELENMGEYTLPFQKKTKVDRGVRGRPVTN